MHKKFAKLRDKIQADKLSGTVFVFRDTYGKLLGYSLYRNHKIPRNPATMERFMATCEPGEGWEAKRLFEFSEGRMTAFRCPNTHQWTKRDA